MADPDRFLLPTLKVEWDAGPVKFISNTSYYDRLRAGRTATAARIYNLSYFQHFLSADPSDRPPYGYPVGSATAIRAPTIARTSIPC